MTRIFVSFIGLLLAFSFFAGDLPGQEPIRMARTPDISPDGKLIAFSYLGDIWIVETIGGVARPVTIHKAHEYNPIFSPDGRYLAFSSNRHGSYNVYVIPVQSGKPRRLTFDSATDIVTGWSPDGKRILFTSNREAGFPPGPDIFSVPFEGGQVRRITTTEAREGSYSPDGFRIVYTRGPGNWYRKGYRGSSNDDIWTCSADGQNHQQITTFQGQDGSPMWSPDGQSIYYVSEVHGTPANIVRQPINSSSGSTLPKQITFHKEDGVRRARISADGAWIVYECGPELWVVSTSENAVPRKLAIEVHTDDKSNTERMESFNSSGSTEFALSPDETHAIIVVHGELYRMSVNGSSKPIRLTTTGVSNHGVTWSRDGNRIIFISDRDGHDNLYALEADDADHPKFTEAHRFKTTRLTSGNQDIQGVTYSPGGKKVSFLRAGKLWDINPDGTGIRAIVNEVQVIDYEWSPDSKWIVYARQDGSFASEMYIIPAEGATRENPARNITRYATYNAGVTWSLDGKKLAFLSNRRNTGTLHVMSLLKPTAPGVAEKAPSSGTPLEIDWEDIHLRVRSIGNVPANEAAISPDGSRVAFRASSGNSTDLWVASIDGGQMTRLTSGNLRPQQITWTRKKTGLGNSYADLIYFRDGNGVIRGVRTSAEIKPDNGHVATVNFQIKLPVLADEEFTEMFDQGWRYLSTYFYDAKFHGNDWEAIRNRYRPLVKHVTMKEDLYALLYLMLGELNASHLGVGGITSQPDEPVADLGLLFDNTYRGKGLKIAEVIKRGPADQRGMNLRPGDVIVSIDDTEITDSIEISKILAGKIGERIPLKVITPGTTPANTAKPRSVEILGTARTKILELLYDRWVEANARRVKELSGGKLGYIHVKSMDEEGLDLFVRSLYSDNFDKEAIVLDVRYNGGGFTHDQILNYLGAKEHTWFRQRDGGEGTVMRSSDRKWTRPLVLLINNRSYSDAEIFPSAFRTLGLGKLVGQATGGHVIGTTQMKLIDGSDFRVPRTGVFTINNVNMDKEGVVPDIIVENHPEQISKGIDAQLDRAVQVLQADVAELKKKARQNVAAKPADQPIRIPAPKPEFDLPVPQNPVAPLPLTGPR